MASHRAYRVALAAVLVLSAGLFFSAREAWRREPALELAVISIVAMAALEAMGRNKK